MPRPEIKSSMTWKSVEFFNVELTINESIEKILLPISVGRTILSLTTSAAPRPVPGPMIKAVSLNDSPGTIWDTSSPPNKLKL